MDLCFIDTSALAKRYVPELGSSWIGTLCQTTTVALAGLAVVEIASVLTRNLRDSRISVAQHTRARRLFLVHSRSYLSIDLRPEVLDRASLIIPLLPHGTTVRSLDAIQLACAEVAFAAAIRDGVVVRGFVSSDQRLLAAAQHLGMPTDNPENHP